MSLETSASETGEKDVNECIFVGKMFDSLWYGELCCEVCNFIVDEGGGGGQRREENVLKSMRELGELLI